jgi:hypothetical protein
VLRVQLPVHSESQALAHQNVVQGHRRPFQADLDKKWDARTQFAELPTIQVPIQQLGLTATNLIERLKLEFENYLGEPDDDTLLAMILDPVMVTTGLPYMRALQNYDHFL